MRFVPYRRSRRVDPSALRRKLAKLVRKHLGLAAGQEQREPNYVGNSRHVRMETGEMKQVMALVLSVALVGASAATTSAQTGTGGGGGGAGTKSTTTTTSPTTTTNTGTKSTTTTTSPTTAPTTTKKTTKMDCPGHAGEHGRHKGLGHNPNC
jgi:hypothetical protein